jgi:GTPase involved in cell partitioning and DNA repair
MGGDGGDGGEVCECSIYVNSSDMKSTLDKEYKRIKKSSYP